MFEIENLQQQQKKEQEKPRQSNKKKRRYLLEVMHASETKLFRRNNQIKILVRRKKNQKEPKQIRERLSREFF
jgi:hypothetical protein